MQAQASTTNTRRLAREKQYALEGQGEVTIGSRDLCELMAAKHYTRCGFIEAASAALAILIVSPTVRRAVQLQTNCMVRPRGQLCELERRVKLCGR